MRFAAAAIIIAAFATVGWGATTVRMSEQAAVAGPKVTLGDIAVVEAANPAEQARLAGIVVGVAAKNEGALLLNSQAVRQALERAGVNVANINICGAATVQVSRSNAAAGRAEAVRAVERYLAGMMPGKRFAVSNVAVGFTPGEGFEPVVVEARPKELDGRVRFDIADSREEGKVIGQVFATVEKTAPVTAARRRIAGGTVLSADDVTVEYRAASGTGETLEAGSAVGQRLVHAVEAGKVITASMLQPENVVKRGDDVVLEYNKGGMAISVKAKALENAAVGDVVRVKRAGGRLEQLAKVEGAGRATPIGGGQE